MFESRSDNSSGGGGLQLVREYFQQRACRHCRRKYSPEGIELVREEPGIMVVKVGCNSCGAPLGIAVVGVHKKQKQNSDKAPPAKVRGSQHMIASPSYPSEWSKSDAKRLADLAPITYDDVLDAHEFFASLDSGWNKHLPKPRRPRQRSAEPDGPSAAAN